MIHKLLAVLLVLTLVPLHSAADQPDQVDPAVLEQLSEDGSASVLIVLQNQVDTTWARQLSTKTVKGAAVVQALRSQAQVDQQPFLNYFEQRNIKAQGFFAVNAISANIDQASLEWVLQQPEVARIHSDHVRPMLEPSPAATAAHTPTTPAAIEPGLTETNAPDVWAAGYTGQGIVVASQDTGVHWTHQAIKSQYRGWDAQTQTADHNYNWHDGVEASTTSPCGTLWAEAPCDDNSHGTHTVGTMVGDDGAANQIGMAPGATWIGCRNMNAGDGTIATYLSCIDWMLAPYPTNATPAEGDPAKAPHIINNSWGCIPAEGCSGDTLDDMQPAIRNLVNAGILFVGSAGNSGPNCDTITTPAAIYPENFIVGAYRTSTGLIAEFSSRGPVTYNGETRIGPDLSAPGVAVRSAVNGSDTAYAQKNGTSMAAPHVAGAAALLWSARPELQGQVWLTRRLLEETARATSVNQTCGSVPGDALINNTFGHGKLDILAAIQPTFSGTIQLNSSAPVSAALVIQSHTTSETLLLPVDADGAWETSLPSGSYDVQLLVDGRTYNGGEIIIMSEALLVKHYRFNHSFIPMVIR